MKNFGATGQPTHGQDPYREVGMDQPAMRDRKQEADGNGSVAMQDIVAAERALIIETFDRLKQRGDGELRVSTRRNPRTGICEIIYCGAHEKTDLAPVRRLYESAGRKTVTF